jgi:hypothetical protein
MQIRGRGEERLGWCRDFRERVVGGSKSLLDFANMRNGSQNRVDYMLDHKKK